MKKVSIDLKNCYGIKNLKTVLDFTKAQAYAIYAPNGLMKSSLAQTFQDASDYTDSKDRIFPDRTTSRNFTDDADVEIEGERILVVKPYDEEYGPTEKTSTLLVDAALRKQYEDLHIAIDEAKSKLLTMLQTSFGPKVNFENEIATTFTSSADFDLAIGRIRTELEQQNEAPFESVRYDVIFNEKVVAALGAKELNSFVEEYIRRYNELLDASTFFKKGKFDYYNAGQIAKSLADNGFFEASHTVNLKASGVTVEINTRKELEEVINDEKETIFQDIKLRKTFEDVATRLQKNVQLRIFCQYLQDNEHLLSKMNNLRGFKEDVLKSYLKVNYELYVQLIDKYDAAQERKAEIEQKAREQQTEWEDVIAIFNDRFFVPFRLETGNRIQVMLGHDPIVELKFIYMDGVDHANIDRSDLLKVLSTGEKKALYVLNVIFEIQRRIKDKVKTLVIVDDIADSFDYQNKYAIIQYLNDISEEGLFKLIIMTHNFDFFRTIESRFVKYSHCLMASRNENGITLAQATGIRNIFANDWKTHFFDDPRKKIASIPFLRNLVEMTTGVDDPMFISLTGMLHCKAGSDNLTVATLDAIFNKICNTNKISKDASILVHDMVSSEADACLDDAAGMRLENKIVLAMAVRLATERFLIAKINSGTDNTANIMANQTQVLIRKFKKQFLNDADTIRLLDRVSLMTPENIHVNSFMYEPIVDMSDDHLKKLYRDVKELISTKGLDADRNDKQQPEG